MKAIENPVSLHIFVSVYISIRAHVYINSYIHELLIVLMLTRLHGFETSLWLITWLQVALIALVPSCIIFTQALRAQVIAYLMARLMMMSRLASLH